MSTSSLIQKLISSTSIDGRYRSIFNLYPNNTFYHLLPYHNAEHAKAVLNLFEILRKLSGKSFTKKALRHVELAIAFHDIQHTGHPDTHLIDGESNITRAVNAFLLWADVTNYPSEERPVVADLIRSTAWPRGLDGFVYDGIGEYAELAQMMQDADILWGTMPECAEQCMLGMWKERQEAGLEPEGLDILKILSGQIKFIQNYQPLSNAGRSYKNAVFVEASEQWALIALQYQRDIEAAALVNEMSDDQVLKLAQAMRHPLKEMAQAKS